MYKVVMTHIKNEKEGREIRLEDIGKVEMCRLQPFKQDVRSSGSHKAVILLQLVYVGKEARSMLGSS